LQFVDLVGQLITAHDGAGATVAAQREPAGRPGVHPVGGQFNHLLCVGFEGVGGQQQRGQFPGAVRVGQNVVTQADTRLPEPGQARSRSSFTDDGAPLI
jgi:hypothetical protein